MQRTGRKRFATWKLLTLSTLALASGGVVVAQSASRFEAGRHVTMMAERAQKEWNLSNAQKTKIKAILQDAVPRGIEIHDNMKLAPQTRQAQLQKLFNTTQNKIGAVLTPTQRTKAAHWRQDARRGAQQALTRMAIELKLTPNQQGKLKPIVMKGFSQAQSLRGDMSLTVAQKFGRLQQIHRTTREQAGRVLTPQQNVQLDKMSGEMIAAARQQFIAWGGHDIKL